MNVPVHALPNRRPERVLVAALLLGLLTACQTTPRPSIEPVLESVGSVVEPTDPRLPVIVYDPARVTPLRAALNHQVTIIFAPGEAVDTVAIGDSDSWQATLTQRGDALVLKPLRIAAPTNMTILTDTRVYSFGLSVAAAPTADMPFTIRFHHPDDAVVPLAPPRRWRTTGDEAARPLQVSDNGREIILTWRSDQAIPAIFSVDDRGHETLLHARIQNGQAVLDTVHARLLFRLDGQSARAERRSGQASR